MTNQQHPITPSPELVQQWLCSDDYPWGPLEQTSITITANRLQNIVTAAAQWGAVNVIRAVTDLPNELEIPFNVITDWEAIPGTCASFYAAAEWGYNQALAAQRVIATELENHQ